MANAKSEQGSSKAFWMLVAAIVLAVGWFGWQEWSHRQASTTVAASNPRPARAAVDAPVVPHPAPVTKRNSHVLVE